MAYHIQLGIMLEEACNAMAMYEAMQSLSSMQHLAIINQA